MAVQSHWFAVGSLVPWVQPVVGAVATQASLEVSYGPRGLALLGGGVDPQAALTELLEADELSDMRQVAIVVAPGTGEPWQRVLSLGIEDDPDPLGELDRLLVMDEAYRYAGTRAPDRVPRRAPRRQRLAPSP